MTTELGYNDAKKLAEEVEKTLSFPGDFIVGKRCKIIEFQHGDGTYCRFVSACYRRITNDWIAIYTEHHRTFVYHTDDLDWVKESRRAKVLYHNKED